jgi:hypothetical protein
MTDEQKLTACEAALRCPVGSDHGKFLVYRNNKGLFSIYEIDRRFVPPREQRASRYFCAACHEPD